MIEFIPDLKSIAITHSNQRQKNPHVEVRIHTYTLSAHSISCLTCVNIWPGLPLTWNAIAFLVLEMPNVDVWIKTGSSY